MRFACDGRPAGSPPLYLAAVLRAGGLAQVTDSINIQARAVLAFQGTTVGQQLFEMLTLAEEFGDFTANDWPGGLGALQGPSSGSATLATDSGE